MSQTSPARGMRDFLPSEKALRERVLFSIRSTYAKYGYVEIETPVLENLNRLTNSQGGDNEKMLFKVMRRGLSAEHRSLDFDELCDLGLRYDLTLPLARFYATNRGSLPKVVRCMQIGPVWRAERPQKGRFRQFTQCDIDVIGEASYLAESELIVATIDALISVGLHDLTVRINDRRLLISSLGAAGVPRDLQMRALVVIDKLDKIGETGVMTELCDLLGDHLAREAFSALNSLSDRYEAGEPFEGRSQLDDLFKITDAVRAAPVSRDVRLEFDPTLVRGMGYYSGPIFEAAHPSFRGAIAGGGRYDGMIGRFTGSDVPATGFSIGFERIVDLVALDPQDGMPRIALLYASECSWDRVMSAQQELIRQGASVRLVERPKRLAATLDGLVAKGFTAVADLDDSGHLSVSRPLGNAS